MANGQPRQGSLERLGISPETPLPDGVLNTSSVSSVRFRISRPEGYAYGDVESFINDYVAPTIKWFEDTLHQRDLAIHKLGEEVDIFDVNNQNLKAALEAKEYNEALGIGLQDEERSSEVDILMTQNDELKQENATLLKRLNLLKSQAETKGETYTADEVESFIAGETESLQEELNIVKAENEKLKAQLTNNAQTVNREPDPNEWVPRDEVDTIVENAIKEYQDKLDQEESLRVDSDEEYLKELLDEEDLSNKAAVKTYAKAYKELETYAHNLEVDNARLRGEDTSRLPKHASFNRYQEQELPEITEEDLRE
jgi:hypothetical protein